MESIRLPSTVLGLCLLALSAHAQQVGTPTSTPAPRVGVPATSPQLQRARTTPVPASVPRTLNDRPQAIPSVPQTGPSPIRVVTPKPTPVAPPRAPVRVIDLKGRHVPGAVQVSPTLAFDPGTGRYFTTPPAPGNR